MKEAILKFYKAYPPFVLTILLVGGIWAFSHLYTKIETSNSARIAEAVEIKKEVEDVKDKVMELHYAIKYSSALVRYENQSYADSLQKSIASQNKLIKSIPVSVNKNTNARSDTVVYRVEKLLTENILNRGLFKRNSVHKFKEYDFDYFSNE